MARMLARGTVHGQTIELDEPVPELDGQRVRLVVEGAGDEEAPLSADSQRKLWREWVERGPQGPRKCVFAYHAFVNDADEIQGSFQPYYEQTTVAEQADPDQLYKLQHELDAAQVYWQSEVEAFSKIFYMPKAKQSVTDQAAMVRHLDPAVDRFQALEEEQKDKFRDTLSAYTRLYAFLSQVIPFGDPDLEKLYSYGRFLLAKLPTAASGRSLQIDEDVALRYYRLQKIAEQDIILRVHDSAGGLKGPTDVGTRQAEDEEVALRIASAPHRARVSELVLGSWIRPGGATRRIQGYVHARDGRPGRIHSNGNARVEADPNRILPSTIPTAETLSGAAPVARYGCVPNGI